MTTITEKKSVSTRYLISLGVWGALFAGFGAYLLHALNFIPFGPGVIWQYWQAADVTPWMRGPSGHIVAILVLCAASVVFAFIYYALFRNIYTIWMGVAAGFGLWVCVFLVINPLVPNAQSVQALGATTSVIMICIFVLYGLFVGYSIAYEHREQLYEQKKEIS